MISSKNWQTKKSGEVAEFINGYPFSPDEWENKGLPIIRIQNLNDPSMLEGKYTFKISFP